MIKINLLPFRAARKRENIKRQITFFSLTVVLLASVMTYYAFQLNDTLSVLKKEETGLQTDLRRLEKTIREIRKLEKEIAEIKAKLHVMKGLEANKQGPVHLLDEIAMAVPKDKLWISSLQESGGSLSLTGTAMDNDTVALFMVNLEKSKYITTVDLTSVKLKSLPQFRLNVSDFILSCKTYAHKPPKPKAKKGKKGRRRRR